MWKIQTYPLRVASRSSHYGIFDAKIFNVERARGRAKCTWVYIPPVAESFRLAAESIPYSLPSLGKEFQKRRLRSIHKENRDRYTSRPEGSADERRKTKGGKYSTTRYSDEGTTVHETPSVSEGAREKGEKSCRRDEKAGKKSNAPR